MIKAGHPLPPHPDHPTLSCRIVTPIPIASLGLGQQPEVRIQALRGIEARDAPPGRGHALAGGGEREASLLEVQEHIRDIGGRDPAPPAELLVPRGTHAPRDVEQELLHAIVEAL